MTENDEYTGGGRIGVGSVVLGRYRLDEQIAAGGMGVLWRATDTVLEGTVALKRVSFAHLSEDQARTTRDRTLREARLAAKLRGHPHVVSLYDIQVDDGDVWLVLEYVPSRSLSQILTAQGALSPQEVARIGADLADALVAAHAIDIQHRDVTPGNVLIGEDGRIKLTDFGIAHSANDPRITQTGAVVGTISYLAPEVAREGESSWASDVFSLGATLYAALEGQPPFGHTENPVKMLHIVSTGIIRPPENAGPLHPILLRLLELNPATRPDAATVRDSLRRTLERSGEPQTTVIPHPMASSGAYPAGASTTGPHWTPGNQQGQYGPGQQSQQGQPGQQGQPWPVGQPWQERSRVARSGSEWATAGRPQSQGPQRAVLAALAVAVVAVVVVAIAVFGSGEDGPKQRASGVPRGVIGSGPGPTSSTPPAPTLPKGPVADVRMPEELRRADSCDLLRLPALKRFGEVEITRGGTLYGCYATVTAPNKGEISIGYEVTRPQEEYTDNPDANEQHDLRGVRVYQEKPEMDGAGNPSCQGQIFLADNSGFYNTAYPINDAGRNADLCGMVRTLNYAATNEMIRNGVPQSGFANDYPLAARDACDLLDNAALSKVKNLSFRDWYPNFAHWGCHWGEGDGDDGEPAVSLLFKLSPPGDFRDRDAARPVTVDRGTAYEYKVGNEGNEKTCTVVLPQEQEPNDAGTFLLVSLQVTTPEPRDKTCGYAKTLATMVSKTLSS